VSAPPSVTLAVTENVAAPDDAVWLDGCDEIVIVGTGAEIGNAAVGTVIVEPEYRATPLVTRNSSM